MDAVKYPISEEIIYQLRERGGTMKKFLTNLWKDESAQGATEYILLLVAVVAVVMLFREKIQAVLQDKLGELSGNIGSFGK
jgi:Flp pilus assembly pilin Flp